MTLSLPVARIFPIVIWIVGWIPFLRGNASLNDGLAALAAAGLALFSARHAWRDVSAPPATPQVAGAVILAGLGLVTDFTLLIAIALVLLACPAGAAKARANDELRLLALLSLPWLATDGTSLALAFRHSAAWTTEAFFQVFGFAVSREGTTLTIEGQPLAVAAACAGLDTLHATLVAGAWLAAALRRRKLFWSAVAALPLLAWVANTSRVIALGGVAITWGPNAAIGWFHTWGGLAVVVVMFALAGAWVAVLRQSDRAP